MGFICCSLYSFAYATTTSKGSASQKWNKKQLNILSPPTIPLDCVLDNGMKNHSTAQMLAEKYVFITWVAIMSQLE